MSRPLGITLLAILQLLGALSSLAIGGLALYLAYLLGGPWWILGAIVSLVTFIIGIIGLIIFFGLWNLKSWAYWLALFVNIVSILTNISPLNPVGLAIPLVIVIYLFTPNVKSAFK